MNAQPVQAGASRLLGRPLAVAWAAAAAILVVTAVGRSATHHPFGYFTRDPAAVTHAHVYLGMVSVFGLFGWCIGAVSLAFGSELAHLGSAPDRRLAMQLGAAALAYLLLDDAFELHDGIYPRLGIPDRISEPVYVLAVAFLVYRGRKFIRDTNWRLLVVAGVFFAGSIASDVATDNLRYVIFEDGTKLIGIATLAAYCVDTAVAEARRTVSAAPQAEAA